MTPARPIRAAGVYRRRDEATAMSHLHWALLSLAGIAAAAAAFWWFALAP
jgi:hypothetical protein